MYKLSEIIKNIERFIPIKNGCIIKNKQRELYLLNDNSLICSNVFDFFTYEKYLIYNEKSGCCIYNLELNTTKCKQNQFALNLKSATPSHWLFTDTSTNLLLFENNFDLDNERLLIKNYDWDFLFLTIVFLYLHDSKNVKSLSLLTGEYEWEVDLGNRKYIDSGEAKIKQIIGIWENKLLVSMTNGELVSINTSTGQIIFETHGLISKIRTNESYKWWDFLLNPHLENGKLFELVGSQYYSFDLNSQNLEILWQDDREEGYVSIKHTTYTEDYIYFTGSLENRFQPHLVGAFNRKTLSIDWVEDVNLSIDPKLGYVVSLNQAPQVSEDKLYVLDSGGTLHIFERETLS